MSILENINQRIIEEYKAGNSETRVYLQTLKSAIMAKAKDKREDLTELEEIQVLKSELKKEEEALSQAETAGREDLREKTATEIVILKSYLPPEISESEIEATVKAVLKKIEDKSFGNVMKSAMEDLKGRADGARVAAIVRRLIL